MTTIIKTGHVQQRLKMHRMMPSTSGRMQGAIRNVAFTKASSNRFSVFLFPPCLNIVLNIVLVRVAVLLPCIGDPAHYWSGRSWLCMERTVTSIFFFKVMLVHTYVLSLQCDDSSLQVKDNSTYEYESYSTNTRSLHECECDQSHLYHQMDFFTMTLYHTRRTAHVS